MNDLEKFRADLIDAIRDMKMRKGTRVFRAENYLCEADLFENLTTRASGMQNLLPFTDGDFCSTPAEIGIITND